MKSIEDEWEREMESETDLDLLFLTYDTGQVTIAELQKTIEEHGFKSEVKEEG